MGCRQAPARRTRRTSRSIRSRAGGGRARRGARRRAVHARAHLRGRSKPRRPPSVVGSVAARPGARAAPAVRSLGGAQAADLRTGAPALLPVPVHAAADRRGYVRRRRRRSRPMQISYRIESRVAAGRRAAGPRADLRAAAACRSASPRSCPPTATRHPRVARPDLRATSRRVRLRARTCCASSAAVPVRRRRAVAVCGARALRVRQRRRRAHGRARPLLTRLAPSCAACSASCAAVQRQTHDGGWTPELAARALAALRVAAQLTRRPPGRRSAVGVDGARRPTAQRRRSAGRWLARRPAAGVGRGRRPSARMRSAPADADSRPSSASALAPLRPRRATAAAATARRSTSTRRWSDGSRAADRVAAEHTWVAEAGAHDAPGGRSTAAGPRVGALTAACRSGARSRSPRARGLSLADSTSCATERRAPGAHRADRAGAVAMLVLRSLIRRALGRSRVGAAGAPRLGSPARRLASCATARSSCSLAGAAVLRARARRSRSPRSTRAGDDLSRAAASPDDRRLVEHDARCRPRRLANGRAERRGVLHDRRRRALLRRAADAGQVPAT